MTLTEQIARLQQDHDTLHALCGEILATLTVNRNRQNLVCEPKSAEADFDRLLLSWQNQFNRVRLPEPARTTTGE